MGKTKTVELTSLGAALNNAFGKVYVLSLKRSKDRRAIMKESCESINLKYKFFNALDGRFFTHNSYYTRDGYMNTYKLPVYTTAAYYAAEICIEYMIHRAISDKVKSFVIMNDDTCFDNYQNMTNTDFNDIKHRLPNDWDIIVLGHMKTAYAYNGAVGYYPNVQHTPGCHAIALNHTVYHDYLLESVKREVCGDHLIDRMKAQGKKVYNIIPDLCLQNRDLPSTCI